MTTDTLSLSEAAGTWAGPWRPVMRGRRHAVSSGHYLATQSAHSVLEAGGNAVDAAVTASMVLAVVHCDQVNFAGVAPMMIYLVESDRVVTIDGVGRWPASADVTFFEREHDGAIPEGVLRTVTPAAPAAYLEALSLYGTMSFGEVAAFARDFAREGFVMYPFLVQQLSRVKDKVRERPSNAALFHQAGRSPETGDLFVQPELAGSLQYMIDEEAAALSQGGDRLAGLRAARDAFYRGDIMRRIVDYQREHGGWLTEEDMASYNVKHEAPVVQPLAGSDVYSCGYWSQGPVTAQTLALLEGFDLAAMGWNSTAYVHHIAEALKLAFADREGFYGDPEFVDVPAERFASAAYVAERRALIRPDRAWTKMPPPGAGGYVPGSQSATDAGEGPFDTSCVTAVDRAGNAICITPSDWVNDTDVIPGLGFAASSRGSQSWGYRQHPSSVAPGKRPRLTPNPALVMRKGGFVMPIGTPGGDSQCQALVQVLMNMLVFGMDAQSSIEAPRFISFNHPDSFAPHLSQPGRIGLEGRFPHGVVDELRALGHDAVEWPERLWRSGGICVAARDCQTGNYMAAADPRRAAATAQAR